MLTCCWHVDVLIPGTWEQDLICRYRGGQLVGRLLGCSPSSYDPSVERGSLDAETCIEGDGLKEPGRWWTSRGPAPFLAASGGASPTDALLLASSPPCLWDREVQLWSHLVCSTCYRTPSKLTQGSPKKKFSFFLYSSSPHLTGVADCETFRELLLCVHFINSRAI